MHGLNRAMEARLPLEHLLDAQLNMHANYSAIASPAEQKLQQLQNLFAANTLAQLLTIESATGNVQYAPPNQR